MSDTNTQTRFQKLSSALKKIHVPPKVIFILVGIASTIWFLIRVIPKPSRASYPCIKVAAPFMSSLVIYLLSIGTTTFALKRFRQNLKKSRYATAGISLIVAALSFSVYIIQDKTEAIANNISVSSKVFPVSSNSPVGEAKGLYPGRVVWAYNPDAVDQTYNVNNPGSEWWWSNERVNQGVVDDLLNTALLKYTNETDIIEAWNKIFKSYNNSAGRGDVGYSTGEKIAIKINLTNQCCTDATRMDASPQVVNAILDQLINNAGVSASNITAGDPYREFRSEYVSLVKNSYPNVNYVDGNGGSGVNQTTPSTNNVLVFSDGQYSSTLPQHYLDATYFINIPCLKTHNEGGITLIAKNHQGSFLGSTQTPDNQFAGVMHYSLPANSAGQGKYRHTVDYMGHEETGGKGLLYIIDGIWAGESWEGFIHKFQSAPFDNTYPSSILIGQDPVALESVCYDILYEEYSQNAVFDKKYPILYQDEITDYLLQCASSDYWPTGITYDPENDGSALSSLGVFEHWNNATDRKYSRNLGTGNGIELIEVTTKNIDYPKIITASNSDLPSNQVNVVYLDSANTVWVGTDAGLARMTSDGWKDYDTILLNSNVNDIAYEFTAYGKELWIATDSGLTVSSYTDLDGVSGATTYVQEGSDIIGNKVSSVMVDGHHNRWVGTDSAINIFKGSSWHVLIDWNDVNGDPFSFKDYIVNDISYYQYDSIALVATNGKGIARLAFDEIDGFSGASNFGKPWASIASDTVLDADSRGITQWYASHFGADKHESPFTKNDWSTFTQADGLQADYISAVHIDNNMNAWLGTSNGISILTDDGGIFKLTTTEGLVNNQVNHISGDINENIWVATSGGIQWFEELAGTQMVIGTARLVSPEDYALDIPSTTSLSWKHVTGAESYYLEVATDAAFSNIFVSEPTYESLFYTLSGLYDGTTYFWRVKPTHSTLNGDWSEVYRFSVTETLKKPELLTPVNNATDVDKTSESFTWTSVDNAIKYNIAVATDFNFVNLVIDDETTSTSYTLSSLEDAKEYYWHVAAVGNSATGEWSLANKFTTGTSLANDKLFASANNIKLYPNPAQEFVNLEITPQEEQNISISIYSTNGKLIDVPVDNLFIGTAGSTVLLDVNNRSKYPSGIYFVMVNGELFQQISRFTVK